MGRGVAAHKASSVPRIVAEAVGLNLLAVLNTSLPQFRKSCHWAVKLRIFFMAYTFSRKNRMEHLLSEKKGA